MSRVHFASEMQHYYCILEIKLIFGGLWCVFASNRIWNTFTKANISTKNTSAKVFFDFEITLSSLVFSKQFCYLCQKRAAKISGKVTEKIRRIWVQNFSVENCISECRVSLKKCLLCASGAETDHPAGITSAMRNKKATRKSGFCCCCALSGLHETMHRNNKRSRTLYGFLVAHCRGFQGKDERSDAVAERSEVNPTVQQCLCSLCRGFQGKGVKRSRPLSAE